MSGGGPDDGDRRFDVAVNDAPPPEREVLDAEPEDEKKRDAALASTFDQELAHDGKSDEELIKERQDDARLLADVVIVTGVIVAAHEAAEVEEIELDAAEEDDGASE